jgi:putative transcriptional regulator
VKKLLQNNNLKETRMKNHISQTELANRVKVSLRHIAFIEAGERKPSLSVALKIAKVLNTRLEDIFFSI